MHPSFSVSLANSKTSRRRICAFPKEFGTETHGGFFRAVVTGLFRRIAVRVAVWESFFLGRSVSCENSCSPETLAVHVS